jgi:hypothetical protein
MIKLDTFGPDDIEVGDTILSTHYEWKVISLMPNRGFRSSRFSTVCRRRDRDDEFGNHMSWRGDEFNNSVLVKPYREIPYDPSQQGDREDDI